MRDHRNQRQIPSLPGTSSGTFSKSLCSVLDFKFKKMGLETPACVLQRGSRDLENMEGASSRAGTRKAISKLYVYPRAVPLISSLTKLPFC